MEREVKVVIRERGMGKMVRRVIVKMIGALSVYVFVLAHTLAMGYERGLV